MQEAGKRLGREAKSRKGSHKRANWPLLRTSPGAVGNLLATEALSLEFPQEGHAILAVREGQEEEGKDRGQKKAIGRFRNLIPGSACPLRSRRGPLTRRLVRMVEVTEQGTPRNGRESQSWPGQPALPGIRCLPVKRGYICPQMPQLSNRL